MTKPSWPQSRRVERSGLGKNAPTSDTLYCLRDPTDMIVAPAAMPPLSSRHTISAPEWRSNQLSYKSARRGVRPPLRTDGGGGGTSATTASRTALMFCAVLALMRIVSASAMPKVCWYCLGEIM